LREIPDEDEEFQLLFLLQFDSNEIFFELLIKPRRLPFGKYSITIESEGVLQIPINVITLG
jgi:hypothetical protein